MHNASFILVSFYGISFPKKNNIVNDRFREGSVGSLKYPSGTNFILAKTLQIIVDYDQFFLDWFWLNVPVNNFSLILRLRESLRFQSLIQ